jgi:hypothetical protein
MLRARYKNVNRVLTGEIGEDGAGERKGKSQTFLSTVLHVFNVVHLSNFLPELLPGWVPLLSIPLFLLARSLRASGPFYLTPSHSSR